MLSSNLIDILNSHISKKFPNITVLNCFDTTNSDGKSNIVFKSYHMRYSSYITYSSNVYNLIIKDTDSNKQVSIPLTNIINNPTQNNFVMKIDKSNGKLYVVDKDNIKYAIYTNSLPTISNP
jgi:hypothetical protein